MLAGLAALLFLALKVSGLTTYAMTDHYNVYANFENIGGLKERAPIRIGGVTVGRVESITLDGDHFNARVEMLISKDVKNLPSDTSAAILTEGLLGANYISLTPGFEDAVLVQGSVITDTSSALVLENLIGKFLFTMKDKIK